jgi:hypothetical protein
MAQHLRSIKSDFSELERAVLSAICEIHSADRAAIEAQLSTATLLGRENTGCGFFTYIETERRAVVAIVGERFRHGPQVKVNGLEHGLGFVLWLKEGFVSCLEGYSYGRECTEGIVSETAAFEIVQR